MTTSFPLLNRYVIPDMPTADQLQPYLQQIDANRWYSNFGPLVGELERRLTAHLLGFEENRRHGDVFMTSLMTCYDALRIGLKLFRLPSQATVLVPAVTFPACPLAVLHAGATPVFVDVAPNSWQLTPEIARHVAQKIPVHAVMPVAVYGFPVPTEEWDAFSEETGIPVIIDAAAAFETQTIPRRCLLAHSFHATKPFAVGEGGLLVSRNSALIEEARVISNFGTRMRIAEQDGSNAKMSEYHAAVGLAQLVRWTEIKQRRSRILHLYQEIFAKAGLPLTLQPGIDKIIASVLILKIESHSPSAIVEDLNSRGVAAHRMYLPPLYRHAYFSQAAIVNGVGEKREGRISVEEKAAFMISSERMSSSLFGIPFHAFLTEKDIDHVVRLLAESLIKR